MKTFDALLEQAFRAGAARGIMEERRTEGYSVFSKPTFAEWRASLSGLDLEEPAEQIELARPGDIIVLTTTDPIFEPVLGRHYRVTTVSQGYYEFEWDGVTWCVRVTGARKVIPGRDA